jgi:hypothetical protein
MGGDPGFWDLHYSMRGAAYGYLCFRSAARFGFGRRVARLAIQCYLGNPGYADRAVSGTERRERKGVSGIESEWAVNKLAEREGERVNHKRLYRAYREAGLCLKRKRRKHCVRSGAPRVALTAGNQEWALDFAHDVVAAGRTIRVLDEVIARRGKPLGIRCDNGPELTSRHILAWSVESQIELRHIQPGKPTQNAHVTPIRIKNRGRERHA